MEVATCQYIGSGFSNYTRLFQFLPLPIYLLLYPSEKFTAKNSFSCFEYRQNPYYVTAYITPPFSTTASAMPVSPFGVAALKTSRLYKKKYF